MNTTQPGRRAQMDPTRAPGGKHHHWVQKDLVCSGNNCDCMSKTCWLAYCCYPCLFQRNYNRYKRVAKNDRKVDIDKKVGWFCAFECCSSGWLHYALPTYVRRKIRHHRGIDGGVVRDCCATACCLPCSLIQEAHELEAELKTLY